MVLYYPLPKALQIKQDNAFAFTTFHIAALAVLSDGCNADTAAIGNFVPATAAFC